MANLFEQLISTAARGAEGLTPQAREELGVALRSLQQADGGFAGLDGRSDPYFSLFAWLSLKALGAAYDRDRLCLYMAAHRRAGSAVDAQCADLLLASESRRVRQPWLRVAAVVACGDARRVYGAFLRALAMGAVPRWLARLAWRRQRRTFAAGAADRLPTPRLAAGLVLATLAARAEAGLLAALESRHCSGGGFVSAPGALPDLLATAAGRFSAELCAAESLPRREDLAFIEACWLEDGLFGASPTALRGDAEHTFYGLLALGTCR